MSKFSGATTFRQFSSIPPFLMITYMQYELTFRRVRMVARSIYFLCPVRPSIHMYQHGFYFSEIWYMGVKCSHYRSGVAKRVGRCIALLFHDSDTRRGWVVSSTHRPHFTPGKEPVPILQETGWAPGPVWTDGKSRPHRDSIQDRPVRSQ